MAIMIQPPLPACRFSRQIEDEYNQRQVKFSKYLSLLSMESVGLHNLVMKMDGVQVWME